MPRPGLSTRSLRRPLLIAVALTAAIGLAGCSAGTTAAPSTSSSGGAAAADKPLRIGFSPFSMQIPAFIGLSAGLTGMAQSQGDTVITADAKGDPSTQLQQLQQWVQLGQVDAIWVIPQSAEAVAPAIKDAQAKGIVVIASGVPADYGFDGPQAGITFTSLDNEAYGTKLGELTAQCINERLDGKGQVIFLQSPSGAQSTSEINDSFKSALSGDAPDSKIVNEQDAADRLGSAQIISSALQGSPDANTVVGTDDESSLGAVDAFAAAGKDPAQTCIVGAGGNDEAVAAVKSGTLYADLAFDFQSDIAQNLGELHNLATDPSAQGQQLTTPITVITK